MGKKGEDQSTWMSASETPKSRLETRSFPPVSTPAPPPPPAAPLKPLKPLSNMSCCHLSGSCLGCNRRKRTHLLTSGSPCLCQSQSPHGWVLGQAGAPLPTGRSAPTRGSPIYPAHPITTSKWITSDRRTYTGHTTWLCRQGDVLYIISLHKYTHMLKKGLRSIGICWDCIHLLNNY